MAGRGTDIKLEAGLMEQVATNYAQWMHRMLQDKKAVSATIYSAREFELTLDALATVR